MRLYSKTETTHNSDAGNANDGKVTTTTDVDVNGFIAVIGLFVVMAIADKIGELALGVTSRFIDNKPTPPSA